MTTIELKKELIFKIAGIKDKNLLNAINNIIENNSTSNIYQISPEQRKQIMEGLEQISRGEFLSDEQVQMEINQWLKEK
jgi:F0F1-type ATP synthase delta subunit